MYGSLKKIGQGGFAEVYLSTLDGEKIAIKKYKLRDKNGVRYDIIRELAILKELKHKNIIKMKRVKCSGLELQAIMEYGGIDMRKYISTIPLEDRISRTNKIFSQISNGLAYVHSCNIIHRDIKPDNILINGSIVKLCDFGISKKKYCQLTPRIGTNNYKAPELFSDIEYDFAIDIWALGCTLYEYISGYQLFKGEGDIIIIRNILKIVPCSLETLDMLGLDIINPDKCNMDVYFKLPPFHEKTTFTVDIRKDLNRLKKYTETILALNPNERPSAILCGNIFNSRYQPKTKIPDLTVNLDVLLFDRVIAKIGDANSYIVKAACALIASKYEKINPILIQDLNVDTAQLLKWEIYILNLLRFEF